MPAAPSPQIPRPPGPGRRGRRWGRLTLRLLLVAAVLPVLLYLTRTWTLHPLLCRAVAWAAPRWTPYDVRVGAIEGDWRTDLRLRDLCITARAGDAPLRALELEEVAARFRIGALLGSDPSGLEHLRLARGRVEVVVPAMEKETEPFRLPEHLPGVEVAGVDVRLRLDAEQELVLDGVALSSSARAAGSDHRLIVERAALWRAGDEVFASRLGASLHRDGATVSLDQLALADLPLTLEARLTGEQLVFELALAGFPLEDLRQWFTGATWRDLAGTLTLEARGSLSLDDPANAQGTLTATVVDLELADRYVDQVRCTAEIADGVARLSGGLVEIRGGRLDVAGGSLALTTREHAFSVDLAAAFDDLASLGALLVGEPDGWSGSLAGELRLEGDVSAFAGHATLAGEAVRMADVDLGSVAFSARADGETLRVTDLSSRSESVLVEGRGSWSFAESRLEDVRLTGTLDRLERFAAVLAPVAGEDAPGRLEFALALDGPWARPSGSVTARGSALVLAGTPLEEVALEGELVEGELAADVLRLRTPYGALSGAADVTLPLDGRSLAVRLRALELRQAEEVLRLVAPVEILVSDTETSIDSLVLAAAEGSDALLELDLAIGARTKLLVRGQSLAPLPFLAPLWKGSASAGTRAEGVDVDLALELSADTLDVEGSLSVATFVAAAGSPPLALELAGSLHGGRLVLERATARLEDVPLIDLTAEFPLDLLGERLLPPGEVSIAGRVTLPPNRELALPSLPPFSAGVEPVRLRGSVDGTLALGGTWERLTGTISLAAREVAVTPDAAPYLVAPATVLLEARLGEALSIERFELELPERGELVGSGSVGRSADVATLVAEGIGGWSEAPLSLDGTISLADVGWAAALSESIWRASGTASGTFRVAGTVGDPRPEATLRVSGGSIKVGTAPELARIALEASYAEGELTLARCSGEMGSSPLEVSGKLSLGGDALVVDLALRGRNVLLSRSGAARLRGDLDLALSGEWGALHLSGDVKLRHSTILQDIDLLAGLTSRSGVSSVQRGIPLPSFREGSLATMELDLRVTSAEPVRIETNLASGDAVVDLHLGGTGEVIVPTGRVFLDGLRVELPGGPVRFQSGLVTFEETNPHVPRLDLVGQARLAGYDVQLLVRGPYDDVEIVASSQPPLQTNELYLLVLTGRVPEIGERTAAAAQALGIYLARDLLGRWAGGPSAEGRESLLDRLEILSGRDVSKAGVMTMEVSYRWLDDVIGTGDALHVVAERDRFEDINMGLRLVFRSH